MKLMTAITVAGAVMAAAGCQTPERMKAKGYVQDPGGNWVRGDRPYFGDGKPLKPPPYLSGPKGQLPDNVIFQVAPYIPPQPAAPPQPVIVTGPGSAPVTTISTPGQPRTTVINWGQPIYNRPYNPYLWNY
jgi:hypothetical protein